MDLNIERKICLLFFSKYLQLVNIFTRFVQKKFSPQGQRKLSLVKDYWSVCCELLLTTEQELLFLCGPALQYLILNYLAQSDSKCCYLPWMGCGLPPSPSFCRVSLTFYRYAFKLLGGERHALWEFSVLLKNTSRCKWSNPDFSTQSPVCKLG